MSEEVVKDSKLSFFHPREKGATTSIDQRITSEITKTSIEITTKDSVGKHRKGA
jgi:hypothetical protein